MAYHFSVFQREILTAAIRFASTWSKISTMRYNPQLARCAEALERSSDREDDQRLVWLVRLQYVYEELFEVQRNFDRGFRDNQSLMQRNLIRAGLESQFREFTQRMPEKHMSASEPPYRHALL
jgi:hypothetical protein